MGPINGWHKNWISELIMQKNTLIMQKLIIHPYQLMGPINTFDAEKWWLHQKYFSIPMCAEKTLETRAELTSRP